MKRLSYICTALLSVGALHADYKGIKADIERAAGSVAIGYVTGLVPVVGQLFLIWYMIDMHCPPEKQSSTIVVPALAGHAAGIATLGYGTYKLIGLALRKDNEGEFL